MQFKAPIKAFSCITEVEVKGIHRMDIKNSPIPEMGINCK